MTLSAAEPGPVMPGGEKPPKAPAGRPLTPKLTAPAKPLVAVTVAVYDAPEPTKIVCEPGAAARAKSLTTAVKLALLVHSPSLTETVINAEPVIPGNGVIVRVRLAPEP